MAPLMLHFGLLLWKQKSELSYKRWLVIQSVQVSGHRLGPVTKFSVSWKLSSDFFLLFLFLVWGHPLW
jgi:hypothetical protein